MKLKSIQITRATEEIIKKYLLAGEYPSFKTITRELSQWLQENDLGAPSFKHRSISRKEITNVDKLNANFKEIEQDIRDIYEATIYQYNTTMRNHSVLEADRSMLRHEMESIKDEIDEILTRTKETDVKYVKEDIINFIDTSEVDLEMTTAEVDAEIGEVTLKEKDLLSTRVILDPSSATVSINSPYNNHQVIESISNAFDDKINTRWWHKVSTKKLNINNKMELDLVIPFGKEQLINKIEFVPHHSKEMMLSLEYSTDGTSFTPLKAFTLMKITKRESFSFPTVLAKMLKIKLTKYEYEDRFGDMYNYTFGAKMIKIHRKEYEESSVLETKTKQLPLDSKRVSFLIHDEKPSGSEIEYEVCLNPEEENNIWHRVSSMDKNEINDEAKVLHLDPNRRDVLIFNRAAYDEKVVNGMKSYKLYTPDHKSFIHTLDYKGEPIIEDIEDPKLYRGIGQIKRESLYVPFKGDVPLMSHWEAIENEKKNMIKMDFFPKQNEFNFRREKDNLYKFTFAIYSESSRSQPLSINSVYRVLNNNVLKAGIFSIYANKNRLIPSNDEVTISMEQGWTEIIILFHIGNVITRADFLKDEFPLTITIGKISLGEEKLLRGELQPLRYTDKDNLYHAISPHNKDFFAIYDREIFLNYDSKDTIFQLVYSQKKRTNVTSYIKVRAKLIRNKNLTEITPKIKKIRIRTM